ncbi:MAG: hypothetical protein J6331_01665 [Lentisphaeria bacterium]|nr:hypothetical protein [Lentisphaeria bacterium]
MPVRKSCSFSYWICLRSLLSSALYTEDPGVYEETVFLAVRYALWQNRGETNMAVWARYMQK